MPFAALVTVIEQVPVEALRMIVPVPVVALVVATVQPAVPVAKLNAPAPEPPVIERLIAVPAGPEVLAGTRVIAPWLTAVNVKVTGAELATRKFPLAGLVATTMQVPDCVVVRLDPVIRQLLPEAPAVPPVIE